ncbi:hypothetical protein [Citricoccus nitrophenolicus]|uniref:hypothetical protein n=1 Tax=Citricoccus nitrophenolicus TaxID=863575 RepID=UPI0039B465CC
METTTDRPRRLHWRHAAILITALTALTLTACSGESEPAGFTEPAGQTSAQASSVEGGSAATPEGQEEDAVAADGAGSSTVDPADAVETVTYDIQTEGIDGTMTVGLHHLRRDGETMELLLTYTPEFQGRDAYALWELHAKNHAMVAPSLFDRENLKKYSILRTAGGWDNGQVWATPHNVAELASGETQAYWANFAAPEDDVETLNVGLPAGAEFEEVTIEEGSQGSQGSQGSGGGEGGGE